MTVGYRVAAAVVVFLLVELGAISAAVAIPEGWATWRIALIAWPVAAAFAAIAAWTIPE